LKKILLELRKEESIENNYEKNPEQSSENKLQQSSENNLQQSSENKLQQSSENKLQQSSENNLQQSSENNLQQSSENSTEQAKKTLIDDIINTLKNNYSLSDYEISFYISSLRRLKVNLSKESYTRPEYEAIYSKYMENRDNLPIPFQTCSRPSMRGRFERFCKYMDIIFEKIILPLVNDSNP
jgi:hypothetical protein